MTDIVTSLRARKGSAYMCQDCYSSTMDDAADEIERLRAALDGVLAICPWRAKDGTEHPEITAARRARGME
jgi:hypothetical protein